jgi:transcriptional regulator with XRE-family HTH domain
MSQQKLATALGVTFQMVQKYERASCRISASRLVNMARVLGVPVTYFFEDVENVRSTAKPFVEGACALRDTARKASAARK